MVKKVRFGVSLSTTLLNNFDQLIEEKGFKSRSHAISEIIRNYLSENQPEKKQLYTLIIFYKHHEAKDISIIENSYPCSIITSTNSHLDLNNSIKFLQLYCDDKMKDKIYSKYKALSSVEKIIINSI
ncbi:MAG: hypothetical protein MJB14_13625 [Spirochaetes bacterium]|nr:hypothetical protein [Spirochaetota bacterium]